MSNTDAPHNPDPQPAGAGPVEREVGPLATRLRDHGCGHVEWHVADPKTGSYCIAFGNSHCADPEREAREWLRKHRAEFPDGRFVGYEVSRVEVLTQTDVLLREAAHALEQCAATIARDTARLARLRPMTEAQIAHLVTEFHRTRRFHGNEPADIVRAVEASHGIHATVADERPNAPAHRPEPAR